MQTNLLDNLDGDESNIASVRRVELDITNFLHQVPIHLNPTNFVIKTTIEITITTGSYVASQKFCLFNKMESS